LLTAYQEAFKNRAVERTPTEHGLNSGSTVHKPCPCVSIKNRVG
jgi:hypothetical protein